MYCVCMSLRKICTLFSILPIRLTVFHVTGVCMASNCTLFLHDDTFGTLRVTGILHVHEHDVEWRMKYHWRPTLKGPTPSMLCMAIICTLVFSFIGTASCRVQSKIKIDNPLSSGMHYKVLTGTNVAAVPSHHPRFAAVAVNPICIYMRIYVYTQNTYTNIHNMKNGISAIAE